MTEVLLSESFLTLFWSVVWALIPDFGAGEFVRALGGSVVWHGAGGFFVPIRCELARWPAQTLQHPVVAYPIHGESSSHVAENDVLLAVVHLDDTTAGWLGCASAAEVCGECATEEIIFVDHALFSLANYVCQTYLVTVGEILAGSQASRGHPPAPPRQERC